MNESENDLAAQTNPNKVRLHGESYADANHSAEQAVLQSSEASRINLDALSKLAQNMKVVNDSSTSPLAIKEQPAIWSTKNRYFESPLIVGLSLSLVGICTIALQLFGVNDYWISLPFQAYWAYWLFKLNHGCGQRYQSTPPISDNTLTLITITNFALMPLMTNYHFIRLLDPFFYLWILTLGYAPYRLGRFIEKHDKTEEKNPKGSLARALCFFPMVMPAAAALTQLILPPDTISPAILFGLFWLFSQGSWIAYITLKLTGQSEQAAESEKTKVYAGTNIVVRYRAFPELERWFKQKFKAKKVAKGAALVTMWIGGPAVVLFTVLFLSCWLASMQANNGVAVGAKAAITASANLQFIFQFIFAIVLGALAGLIYVLSKPTHIALGEQGIRLLWRNQFFKRDGSYFPWSKLTNIYIEKAKTKSAIIANKLCFRDDNNRVQKIRLNAIDSYEDKELLLNAIRTWAAKVSRDAQVVEGLQPPSDYSYTELWLQALSAPPKRERFKPLVQEAMLKNNRYRVLNSLGSGGQGFAYLADDCSNQSQVVLKEFILPVYVDVSVRKSALKQFENEARILSQLQHPQIVRLLDFFVEDHRAYLVLEHIDGSSMRAIVESSGALSETNTLALASQMCDILKYLHSQIPPVVHRDFTPDNIILGKDGILKLIDFNVAQNTESTTTGTVVGKPAYLPPEQFRGMPTSQSDIYAMGATLFFLLTASDPKPISVSHPVDINNQINQNLDTLIARATDLDCSKRYADIEGLSKDLQKIIS